MRSILLDPDVWCQGALALGVTEARYREPRVTSVRPLSPFATRWCLVGAACVATREPLSTNHPVARYLTSLLHRRFEWPYSVQRWNDHRERTWQEVLGLIDTALEELKP